MKKCFSEYVHIFQIQNWDRIKFDKKKSVVIVVRKIEFDLDWSLMTYNSRNWDFHLTQISFLVL